MRIILKSYVAGWEWESFSRFPPHDSRCGVARCFRVALPVYGSAVRTVSQVHPHARPSVTCLSPLRRIEPAHHAARYANRRTGTNIA